MCTAIVSRRQNDMNFVVVWLWCVQFHASNGAIALSDDIARLGADHPYTCLVPNMEGGVDPDDTFSKVPYEKGFYFLYYLQVSNWLLA